MQMYNFITFCLVFLGTANCASLNTRQSEPCEQIIPCPRIYRPVCGEDGVTYSNACELNSTTCGQVAMVYEGPCRSPEARRGLNCSEVPPFCTFIYDPVCGSDGVTYPNECSFNARTCDTDITIVSQEECPNSRKRQVTDCEDAPTFCPMIYAPVCGTDGNTYGSQCMFNAQTCGTDIQIASQGECPLR